VHPKMFDHLVNGVESSHRVTLNLERFQQFSFRESVQDFLRLLHRALQSFEQHRLRRLGWCVELSRSVPRIFQPIERPNYPLPDVAIQVQQKISNAIAGSIRTPPNLLIVKWFDGALQAWPELVQKLGA